MSCTWRSSAARLGQYHQPTLASSLMRKEMLALALPAIPVTTSRTLAAGGPGSLNLGSR